jgi:hypothetical protein
MASLVEKCRQDRDLALCFRIVQHGTLDYHDKKSNLSFVKVKGLKVVASLSIETL